MAIKLTKDQSLAIKMSKAQDTFLVAGAGAGKTATLVALVNTLIKDGVHPSELLVLTYTTKASQEMKDRIFKQTKHQDLNAMTIGTFHSVFTKIIKDESKKLGIKKLNFVKEYEVINRVKKSLSKFGIDNDNLNVCYEYMQKIERNKNFLITPEKALENIKKEKEKSGKAPTDRVVEYNIYKDTDSYFKKKDKFDFADVLMIAEDMLRNNKELNKKYSSKYKYIIVDESQDLNLAQILILNHLKSENNIITCIGDFRQSIYGFRGSVPSFMLRHSDWFSGSKMTKLNDNFRSTENIVKCANVLISNSKSKLIKEKASPMKSTREEGKEVKVLKFSSDKDEALFICEKIKELKEKNDCVFGDFAVLSRCNSVLSYITDYLKKDEIPYILSSEKSFWESQEIRRITGFFMLLDEPDNIKCLHDIAENTKMKYHHVQKIAEYSKDNGVDLIDALRDMDSIASESRERLYNVLEECTKVPLLQAIKYIISTFDIIKYYDNQPKGENSIANIKKLLLMIKDGNIESAEDLVDYIMFKMETGSTSKEENAVNVMTIHSSKGLEFKTVFVAGVEDGILPDFRAKTLKDKEEERRTLYVALTRAEDELFISYARQRMKGDERSKSTVSPLLSEIGKHVKINKCKSKF